MASEADIQVICTRHRWRSETSARGEEQRMFEADRPHPQAKIQFLEWDGYHAKITWVVESDPSAG